MTDIEIAWLAGILEGEGCFAINRTPKITLSMTDADIIQRVASMCHKKVYTVPPRKDGWKTVYRVEVFGEQAIELMRKILPHMGQRRSKKINEVIQNAYLRPGIASGQGCGSAKISDIDAVEIKKYFSDKTKVSRGDQTRIAKQYNITQAAVWYTINTRKNATLIKPLPKEE